MPAAMRSLAAISAISSGGKSGTNALGCGGRSFGAAPSGGPSTNLELSHQLLDGSGAVGSGSEGGGSSVPQGKPRRGVLWRP
jgi:hypothetical protein